MEVIYTGLHQTPEQIVETAIQEDADAVGISILSGAHMTLVPKIVEGLRADATRTTCSCSSEARSPIDDASRAEGRRGVAEVFTPGAPTSDIVDFLRAAVVALVADRSRPVPGYLPGSVSARQPSWMWSTESVPRGARRHVERRLGRAGDDDGADDRAAREGPPRRGHDLRRDRAVE